jgi:hypothetical protein
LTGAANLYLVHAKEKEERESKNGAVRRELHGEREEELEP